ncbi:Fur family transcriptional regulator [Mycolicibacterium goodii]
MAVLSDTRQSKTTAQLRDDVRERFGDPVVIEAVYRNLTVLQRRGDVRRSKSPGRDAHWLPAE